MQEVRVPLLIISGPVGVGKTTVANEVSSILERRDVAHTLLDMDVLAETYPRAADDPFAQRLALKNLRDVWRNSAATGSQNLVIPRVVESQDNVISIVSAVPNAQVTVCQLFASADVLTARVHRREMGLGREWHEARALELAVSLRHDAPADFTIETDNRVPLDIAQEIVAKVAWVEPA